MKKKKYLYLSYILIIFSFGLWPFNFQSVNGVDWIKNENGIHFFNRGIVYGLAEYRDSNQLSLFEKSESISIELWLKPGSEGYDRFAYIFCFYDGQQREIFSLSQVKSLLNISKYNTSEKKGSTHNLRWLKNVFFKGQKRFLTLTSDKTSTTVYIDGGKVIKFKNYSLMFSRNLGPEWRMLIGNDPTGTKPWTGKIHGLAIYNHALSPGKIIKHFEKWRNKSALSLLKERGIIALYPMDERNGQTIHNAVSNQYHLSIPAKFKILKKTFLKLSDNALKLNGASLRDMHINILGFMPLGFLLLVTFYSAKSSWTSSWRYIFLAVFGGTVVSLIIEILQAYLPTRNSSLTDLIFNSFGTGLGVIFALFYMKIKNYARKTGQTHIKLY